MKERIREILSSFFISVTLINVGIFILGEVFRPEEIYRRVWQDEPYGSEGTVAVHIRKLREKTEITPAEPRYLKTVWGQGYKFEAAERRREP